MPHIALMFKIHQPYRHIEYTFFDLGTHRHYFNNELNKSIINKVSENCYLPANKTLMKLIEAYPDIFKINMSISGVAIEQFKKYRPDVLRSFVDLVNTGCVELLCEPYYHSLASLYTADEFTYQVIMHRQKVYETFQHFPVTFLNTEMLYNNSIAKFAADNGFKNIITEGVDYLYNDIKFDKAYTPPGTDINVFMRNHNFSNDIGYRFTDRSWPEYPLTPYKYYRWMDNLNADLINIFLDYETFGEHHKAETGIFEFFENWVNLTIKKNKYSFNFIKELEWHGLSSKIVDIPHTISWADTEKDASAWTGNVMQHEALMRIYDMEQNVLALGRDDVADTWRKLQTSDHFYYMSTKGLSDGNVHNYFSPYQSPHDAYRYYMNIVSDFELMVRSLHENKAIGSIA